MPMQYPFLKDELAHMEIRKHQWIESEKKARRLVLQPLPSTGLKDTARPGWPGKRAMKKYRGVGHQQPPKLSAHSLHPILPTPGV